MLKKKVTTPISTQAAIAELFLKLKEQNCDPVLELARLAMDPTTPLDSRIGIFKELAQYIAPKRRAVDVVQKTDDGITVKIVKYSRDTVGQAQRMMKPEALRAIKEGKKLTSEEAEEQKEAVGS